MNTKVKSKKNYDSNARELVWKLQKADTQLKLFFNILSDAKKIKLSEIHDKLKFLYPINKASLKSLNHMLAKFKIQIINDTTKKAMSKNHNIQTNEPYRCHVRRNGKPRKIDIAGYRLQVKSLPEYNQAIPYTYDYRYDDMVPMVINHGN